MRPHGATRRLLAAAILIAAFGASPQVSAEAEPDDARALLARMSREIEALQSFAVSGDAYTDAWLEEGLIIEQAADVTLKVRRPGEMRLTKRDPQTTKEIFFSGGVLTVFDHASNLYAQKEIQGDVGAAFDDAVNVVGIDAPLLDFVAQDISDHLLKQAQEVRHLGTSLIRGRRFEHVSIRDPDVDVQIWIAAEGRPLPGKMTIRSKWEAGGPRFVAFLEWDPSPEFGEDALRFEAPDAATRIEFDLDLELDPDREQE